MNILIVDDFKPIVETIAENIKWDKLGFENVYQANSAKEAKLLLANFQIDVMLCDIEMPEENGLQLLSWAKERFPDIECIFLTSHAEFDFAVEAMKLGSFDYVLQPAKFEDITAVLERLAEKMKNKRRIQTLEAMSINAASHRDNILELMKVKIEQGKEQEADQICSRHVQVYASLFDSRKCEVRQLLVRIEKWNDILKKMDDEEVKLVLKRTITSLLDESKVRVAVVACTEELYWIVLFLDSGSVSDFLWVQKVQEFKNFICSNLNMTVSVISEREVSDGQYASQFKRLMGMAEQRLEDQNGIYIAENELILESSTIHPSVVQSIEYIKKNINKNISRSDVAAAVGLSDEYFSRLFKKETGATYKEYSTMLKLNEARKLLETTNLSVGIIASKVGYTNFSHFSQAFKEYSGYTPGDYKKMKKEQEE